MTHNAPLISVVIPAYNAAGFLEDAVDSIVRQSYKPLEIIVVDDGSTDKTRESVAGWEGTVRYLFQKNGGPAAARNSGLKEARGDLIAFLDADDIWTADTIKAQLDGFEQNPSADIVFAIAQRAQITKDVEHMMHIEKIGPAWVILSFGCGLFRKSVFGTVGLLDESLRLGEDVDWFMRAREKNVSMAFVAHVGLLYRMHGESVTHAVPNHNVHFVRALKKSLDRRRAANNGASEPLPTIPGVDEIAKQLGLKSIGGKRR